jgi:hypothetical protein
MKYRLALTTPPKSEPVTLQEAKDHFYGTNTNQDAVTTGMIKAAREQVEDFTSRGLMPQTFTMYLDGFPSSCDRLRGSYSRESWGLVSLLLSSNGAIDIPRAPLISVDSIKYIDTTGALQTLDSALYQVDPQSDDDPVRILPSYGNVWPATRPQPNAVTVQFKIGYVDAAHVPERCKLAIKQTLASWFEDREAVVGDTRGKAQVLPNEAKDLLWDLKLF